MVAGAKFLVSAYEIYVDEILVATPWQRQRIATYMLLYAARSFGAESPMMRLCVRDDNEKALGAYATVGFQEWQMPEGSIWGRHDAARHGTVMLSIATGS